MSYEIAVTPERELGEVRLSGCVTGDTILQAIRALCTSEKWMRGYNTLWDVRKMRGLAVAPMEATDILDQVRHLEERIGSGRTAVVVRDATDFALFSMLILKADAASRNRKVFYSIDEALSWIRFEDTRSGEKTFIQKAARLVGG